MWCLLLSATSAASIHSLQPPGHNFNKDCCLDIPLYVFGLWQPHVLWTQRKRLHLGCLYSHWCVRLLLLILPNCSLFAAEVLLVNSFSPASCITLESVYFDSYPIPVLLTLERPCRPHKTALIRLSKHTTDKFSYKQVKWWKPSIKRLHSFWELEKLLGLQVT